jgi:hypothetical protein
VSESQSVSLLRGEIPICIIQNNTYLDYRLETTDRRRRYTAMVLFVPSWVDRGFVL